MTNTPSPAPPSSALPSSPEWRKSRLSSISWAGTACQRRTQSFRSVQANITFNLTFQNYWTTLGDYAACGFVMNLQRKIRHLYIHVRNQAVVSRLNLLTTRPSYPACCLSFSPGPASSLTLRSVNIDNWQGRTKDPTSTESYDVSS